MEWDVFWWFERDGVYTRCEVLELPTGSYEFRVIDPDGTEQIEHLANSTLLATRQRTLERRLASEGWTRPRGWAL
jgi:hypothetical protein